MAFYFLHLVGCLCDKYLMHMESKGENRNYRNKISRIKYSKFQNVKQNQRRMTFDPLPLTQ